MSVPHPSVPARRTSSRQFFGLFALGAAVVAVACLANAPGAPVVSAADPTPPTGKPKETLVGGVPLWNNWPKQKPDAVIVFTGQTHGYLQPCGCSRPQIGGLERRAYFIETLKAKGWPVVGVDLGDLYPEKVALADQGKLKYKWTMTALRDMGYVAVGIGQTEIKSDLISLLAEYSLQKEQRPFVLAGNVEVKVQDKFVPRADYFPAPPNSKRPVVDAFEVAKAGDVHVGVVGVIGKALQEDNKNKKWDESLDFPNAKKGVEDGLAALAKQKNKPELKALIFQGPPDDAVKVATDFPEFQAIICRSDTDLPRMQPKPVQHKDGSISYIVEIGHRGQHVGVLAAFKKNGGFDFKYQLVPLGEEYITPGNDAAALQSNKALQALDEYAKAVKVANFLPKYPRTDHPAQIHAAALKPPVALTYVGSAACAACHAAEFKKWQGLPHARAMATLQNVATRPNLREFDGECVRCHSTGFDHNTGAYDKRNNAAQNLVLHNVGCENCHGPGSGHVAAPKNKDLLALMSPWKQPGQAGGDKIDPKLMKELAETPLEKRGQKQIQPGQAILRRIVENTCTKCHDHEADPHFDLDKQWPKIEHSGLAPQGGWPAKAPVEK